MIRAAVCVALVAFVGQIHCGYISPYNSGSFSSFGSGGSFTGGQAVVKVGGGGMSSGFGSSNVRFLDGGSSFSNQGSSSRGQVINVGGGSLSSGAPVRVQCPSAAPRRIHVKAGSSSRPRVQVLNPPPTSPLTIQCPHAAGSNILVQGAQNPRPIVTVDNSGLHHGFGSGNVQVIRSGTSFSNNNAFVDNYDDSDSGSFDDDYSIEEQVQVVQPRRVFTQSAPVRFISHSSPSSFVSHSSPTRFVSHTSPIGSSY